MATKKPTNLPLFTVKAGSIKPEDIQRIEKLCGICILEIAELSDGRFVTTPPVGDVSMQARAAMETMLALASHAAGEVSVSSMTRLYTKLSLPKPEGAK